MVIFPNHTVLKSDDELMMELAEADLVKRLRSRCGDIAIAAFQEERVITSLQGRVPCVEVGLFRLNMRTHEGSVFIKMINYLWAMLMTPVPLLRNRMAYIFCPGYCAMIASAWAILLGRPYGLYVRGTWLSPDGRTSWVWKQIFKRSSFIIATGEAFRRRLSKFNEHVENEVPLTNIASVGSCGELRQRVRSVQKVLFVGRLSESKGVIDLIRAIGICNTELALKLELLIAGGGTTSELAEVRRVAEESRVTHCVSFLGHVVDVEVMKQNYQEADVFVFPSYYKEGFPRVLYEAMMYALPIVTTNMPGTEGFLIDSNNCLICKPRHPQDVASCIARIANDPELRIRIGTEAHQAVTEVFASFRYPSHADQLTSMMEQRL